VARIRPARSKANDPPSPPGSAAIASPVTRSISAVTSIDAWSETSATELMTAAARSWSPLFASASA
jgi:hypothetical protein